MTTVVYIGSAVSPSPRSDLFLPAPLFGLSLPLSTSSIPGRHRTLSHYILLRFAKLTLPSSSRRFTRRRKWASKKSMASRRPSRSSVYLYLLLDMASGQVRPHSAVQEVEEEAVEEEEAGPRPGAS